MRKELKIQDEKYGILICKVAPTCDAYKHVKVKATSPRPRSAPSFKTQIPHFLENISEDYISDSGSI